MTIPSSIHTLLGPIPVISNRKEDKLLKMMSADGSFDTFERAIRLKTNLHEQARPAVFAHEVMHAIIYDSGLDQLIDNKMQEAICDAFGTWAASAMKAGKLSFK